MNIKILDLIRLVYRQADYDQLETLADLLDRFETHNEWEIAMVTINCRSNYKRYPITHQDGTKHISNYSDLIDSQYVAKL